MKDIVIFYGPKGSGKDTCFELLQKQLFFKYSKTANKFSFAHYLKEVVFTLFKNKIKDRERIYGAIDKKEEIIEGWEIPQNVKEACGFEESYWSGRRLLQWFGTDVCRNVYEDVWVDSTIENMNQLAHTIDIFAFTDCRFNNEYNKIEKLRKQGFHVHFVKIIRFTENNNFGEHVSEKDMVNFKYNHIIDNTGNIDDLHKEIEIFIKTTLEL